MAKQLKDKQRIAVRVEPHQMDAIKTEVDDRNAKSKPFGKLTLTDYMLQCAYAGMSKANQKKFDGGGK